MHYEHGIIIHFNEKKFSSKNANIIIENNLNSEFYTMKRIDKCLLSSETIPVSKFKNIKSISIVYESEPIIVNKFEISGLVFLPGECYQKCTNCENCSDNLCNQKNFYLCNKTNDDKRCCNRKTGYRCG